MHILSKFEVHFVNEWAHGRWLVFKHDNAQCHKSGMTNKNLQRHEIFMKNWPPYTLDLNTLELVLARLKKFILDSYRRIRCDPKRIALANLWSLINAAWYNVSDYLSSSFITLGGIGVKR